MRAIPIPALKPDLALDCDPAKLAGGVRCIGVRQRGLPPGGGASRIQEVAFARDRLQQSMVANGSEGRLCTEIRQQGAIAA